MIQDQNSHMPISAISPSAAEGSSIEKENTKIELNNLCAEILGPDKAYLSPPAQQLKIITPDASWQTLSKSDAFLALRKEKSPADKELTTHILKERK